MRNIIEIISESSKLTSTIEWLDWNRENCLESFKEIVDECENDHKAAFRVNILIIAKEKKTTKPIDKFKGNYKCMCSEVIIYWKDNTNIPGRPAQVEFWPKNISEQSIIKFIPMNLSLPTKLR